MAASDSGPYILISDPTIAEDGTVIWVMGNDEGYYHLDTASTMAVSASFISNTASGTAYHKAGIRVPTGNGSVERVGDEDSVSFSAEVPWAWTGYLTTEWLWSVLAELNVSPPVLVEVFSDVYYPDSSTRDNGFTANIWLIGSSTGSASAGEYSGTESTVPASRILVVRWGFTR